MNNQVRPDRIVSFRDYNRRKLAPMVEMVETRQMLDAGVGLIAGSVYFDVNKSGGFDGLDTPLAGVTVELYKAGDSSPTASTLTDASGRYAFSALPAGSYTVKQVAPTAKQVLANRFQSDLYQVTSTDPAALHIVIPDSAKVFVNYGGVSASQYLGLNNVVNGKAEVDATGALAVSLGSAAGQTDLNPSLSTFCLDDEHRLTFEGGESYQVVPTSITNLTNGTTQITAERAGRIAYLYNHFGNSSLTNIQAAGLQLAIWELIYDTGNTADFTSGNFQSLGPLNPADQAAYTEAVTAATNYVNASAGQNEPGLLLQASAPLGTPAPGVDGYQSVVARAVFDFLDTESTGGGGGGGGGGTVTPRASISGYVYCDANDDGVKQATEQGISSVLVTLSGTNDLGQPVNLSTTTDAQGFYQFPVLRPGTYTITETQPAGYLDGKDTQGTPGNGQTGQDVFTSITLADKVDGQNNNFGEHLPAPEVTKLTLYGIHQQSTQIVLNVQGDLDEAEATNPANYTLIALGKDQRLGTCDDQLVPIKSITYDAKAGTVTILPATHLNIHYHYLLRSKVNAASDCTGPMESTKVFGRSSLAGCDLNGKTYPVPRMTPCQQKHDQDVVSKAISAWNRSHGTLPKRVAVVPRKTSVGAAPKVALGHRI